MTDPSREPLKFLRAVEGTAPRPTELEARLQHLPGYDQVMRHAVELVWRARSRLGKGSHGNRARRSAFDVLNEIADDELRHLELLRVALMRAQQSPRYWDVGDPRTSWYCSWCRKSKPIEEFEGCPQFRCKTCHAKAPRYRKVG